MLRYHLGLLICLASAVLRCAALPEALPAQEAADADAALVDNGGFEDGDLSDWNVGLGRNVVGPAPVPPTSVAELGLVSTGTPTMISRAIGGGACTPQRTHNKRMASSISCETLLPISLSPNSTLRYPRYGAWAAVVNEGGKDRNSNVLHQTRVVTGADVDPADGRIHMRAAIAPVISISNHTLPELPHFFVIAENVSRGTVLDSTYGYENQPGRLFRLDAAPGFEYSDWLLLDLKPTAGSLAVGETVKLSFYASGCTRGGHIGTLYVDGVGAFIPGIAMTAAAPQKANPGAELTYSYLVQNYGKVRVENARVNITLPHNTTFVALDPHVAPVCTAPEVGTAGTVSCDLGPVGVAQTSTFTMRVKIADAASGALLHYIYTIEGDGASPLLGPLTTTTLLPATLLADLRCDLTSENAAVGPGDRLAYTLQVRNDGPAAVSGAQLTTALPPLLADVSWRCAGEAGANSSTANGSGPLNVALDLQSGTQLRCTLEARALAAGRATLSVGVTPPPGVTDSDPRNDTAVSVNDIGAVVPVTVYKSRAGSVLSTPLSLTCSGDCGSRTVTFLAGSTVSLTATPDLGASFLGWSGDVCHGTTNPCVFVATAAPRVQANFSQGVALCAADGDCAALAEPSFCDGSLGLCTAKLSAGALLPHDAEHGYCLLGRNGACETGACNGATNTCGRAAGQLCQSAAMCIANRCGDDGLCGLAVGSGPCTTSNASMVCRSGGCQDGVCSASAQTTVCNVDASCGASAYCAGVQQICMPRLPQAAALPKDGLHDGICRDRVSPVCASGACNDQSHRCARDNGERCSTPTDCASNLCAGDGRCGALSAAACDQNGDCRQDMCLAGRCAAGSGLVQGRGMFGGCSGGGTAGSARQSAWLGLGAWHLLRRVRRVRRGRR